MKICKRFFLSAILVCTVWVANAQNSAVVAPTAPLVTPPSMPTVTAPSIGNNYYFPGIRSGATQMRQSVSSATQTEQTTAASEQQTAAQRVTAMQSANAFSGLTASDLTSLDSMGMLGSVSGLLGKGNLSALASQSLGATTVSQSTDSLLLQQILAQLTELKTQLESQKEPSVAVQKTAAEMASDVSAQTFSQEAKAGPKILRFVVNGYNVLSTCRDIYFSTQEADGSFLLTGDRKYLSDGANRSETFHLLFKANGAKEGITHYVVTSAVTQDFTNEYSFLYQLSQKSGLDAQQTGNLISMRVNEPNWKFDLLLSMDR